MMINGLLAGLVAITAPSGFVSPASAVVIGAIAGVLVVYAVSFFENVLKIDDPVGAISVHGVNGLWGQLALGIFADGTANYGGLTAKGALFGDWGQLGAQMIGAVVCFVWAFGVSVRLLQGADGGRALPQQAGRRGRWPRHSRDGRRRLQLGRGVRERGLADAHARRAPGEGGAGGGGGE